jgi:arsenical pump membrane protein
VLAILVRPKNWPEAVWPVTGALLLLVFRLLAPSEALYAIRQGTSVYLFLAGMMLLAELARRQGLFDYLASHAVTAAQGSRTRLFLLIYAVGVVVTAVLSNDATAVVLTPAVYAALKKTGAPALPYLLICAFIANAASFVLPISNPANLVIFGRQMPSLIDWVKTFALPSIVSIVATYLLLRALQRDSLRGSIDENRKSAALSHSGRVIGFGILGSAIALLAASAFHVDLGIATILAAGVVLALVLVFDRGAFFPVVRDASWSILPLVAGLFVIVRALDTTGAVLEVRRVLHDLNSLPPLGGALAASFGIAAASNIANNLPVALLAESAVQDHVPRLLRNALVVGVDLGPNFSITGSLATILWLIAIRREGVTVGFWQFLRVGALVTAPALFLATCALLISA